VAKLLGYALDLVATPDSGVAAMHLTLTYPVAGAMKDFALQQVALASRGVHRLGEIDIESSPLSVHQLWPQGWKEACYGVGVWLSVTNRGKTPYYADNCFVRVEVWDGSQLSGRDVRGCAENAAVVSPGETEIIAVYPLLFPLDETTPLRRLVYMDGFRRFEWAFEPSKADE
jgi:hypothetical protein